MSMKIEIEIEDDIIGLTIHNDDEPVTDFEKMSRKEQIKVVNSLAQFYTLFYKYIKEKDEEGHGESREGRKK